MPALACHSTPVRTLSKPRVPILVAALLALANLGLPAWSMTKPGAGAGTRSSGSAPAPAPSGPGLDCREFHAALIAWVDARLPSPTVETKSSAATPAASPVPHAGPATTPPSDAAAPVQAGAGAPQQDPGVKDEASEIVWQAINDDAFIQASWDFEGHFLKAMKRRHWTSVDDALRGGILKNKRSKVHKAYAECYRMARLYAAGALDIREAAAAEADRPRFESLRKDVEKGLQVAVRDCVLNSPAFEDPFEDEAPGED